MAKDATNTPNAMNAARPLAARWLQAGVACLAFLCYAQWRQMPLTPTGSANVGGLDMDRLQADLRTCAALHAVPIDPPGVGRNRSERYVEGQPPTLIRNASVWTGEDGQRDWLRADVFLEGGLIQRVEPVSLDWAQLLPADTRVYDAQGRPLTAGLVDMHSHMGLHGLPTLHGNEDVTELAGDTLTPWARAADGFQPTDRQIQVIKSGGVTTSLVLPGSSNNMGGEALVVKHAVGPRDGRPEISVADMLADPGGRWRHLKMACGENAKQVHGRAGERGPKTRQGEVWALRQGFGAAQALIQAQDDWCRQAGAAGGLAGGLAGVRGYLPQDAAREPVAALLRGQAHVHVHCYTVPDLEAFVGLSRAFGFPVRAFHHAHQAHLVPEVLLRAFGRPPALALFADNMWYKAESALAVEHAGRLLFDRGLTPVYVSDNPVLNAQHLLLEAAKAYRYGLPYHAALAAVTAAPADRLGLGRRLGRVLPGYDADVVVWDSDPLSVGATPAQIWIDGTAQYERPEELAKEEPVRRGEPVRPEVLDEAPVPVDGRVVFTGLVESLHPLYDMSAHTDGRTFNVVVADGEITCVGQCTAERRKGDVVVLVRNGTLTLAMTALGTTLGLNAIDGEADTDNGGALGSAGAGTPVFSRAVDGLALGTDKLAAAFRYGVTRAVSAPGLKSGGSQGTHHGTSAGFHTGAETAASRADAVFVEDAALHYTLDLSAKAAWPSVSAAVGALRAKLLAAVGRSGGSDPESTFLQRVVAGDQPLAITVHSADTMAALLRVKATVEAASGTPLRLVLIGGAEAHLVADALAAARIGVVLAPMQSFAIAWDQRRALPGVPLTANRTLDVLVAAGVTVAIGLEEDWLVRDMALLAGVAWRNSRGRISRIAAFDLVSRNVYRVLGLPLPDGRQQFVVHAGDALGIDGRVQAVGDGSGHVWMT